MINTALRSFVTKKIDFLQIFVFQRQRISEKLFRLSIFYKESSAKINKMPV